MLIQKDVKLIQTSQRLPTRLRALLIQKDVKRSSASGRMSICLRALLIQKDVKLTIVQLIGLLV